MDINELESYRLSDAVKFHRRLNPQIWGADEHLLPQVQQHLLAIADDFREFLGVADLAVKDITISGSNAAYNYTDHSDIDLHLVVDVPTDPVYRELFNAKKYQYNDEHNIRIGPYDVELYVQDSNEPIVSQGIYSVREGQWISVPRRKAAKIDDAGVRDKYADMGARVEQAIASGDRAQMDRTIQKVKALRKAGLDQQGEFSAENLAYKLLRNQGLIERLYSARNTARDQELSITERKKKRRKAKKRVRYAYGGWWYPGFGYGSSDSGEGDGGGGESRSPTVTETKHTEIIRHQVGPWVVYLNDHAVVRAMTRGIGPRMMSSLISSLVLIPDLEHKVPVGGDFWIKDRRTKSSFYFKRLDIPSEPLAVRCETGVRDDPRHGKKTPVFELDVYPGPETADDIKTMKYVRYISRFVGVDIIASNLARRTQKELSATSPEYIRDPRTQDSRRYDRAFKQRPDLTGDEELAEAAAYWEWIRLPMPEFDFPVYVKFADERAIIGTENMEITGEEPGRFYLGFSADLATGRVLDTDADWDRDEPFDIMMVDQAVLQDIVEEVLTAVGRRWGGTAEAIRAELEGGIQVDEDRERYGHLWYFGRDRWGGLYSRGQEDAKADMPADPGYGGMGGGSGPSVRVKDGYKDPEFRQAMIDEYMAGYNSVEDQDAGGLEIDVDESLAEDRASDEHRKSQMRLSDAIDQMINRLGHAKIYQANGDRNNAQGAISDVMSMFADAFEVKLSREKYEDFIVPLDWSMDAVADETWDTQVVNQTIDISINLLDEMNDQIWRDINRAKDDDEGGIEVDLTEAQPNQDAKIRKIYQLLDQATAAVQEHDSRAASNFLDEADALQQDLFGEEFPEKSYDLFHKFDDLVSDLDRAGPNFDITMLVDEIDDLGQEIENLAGHLTPEPPEEGGIEVDLTEAALSTPDGVSPSTKMFLSETDRESILKTFIKDTARRLGIQRMPRVHFHRRPDWSRDRHSFGMYEPETHELHVSLPGRHLLDILRTTAHELVHCRQHEIKPLPQDAGKTGSRYENQAHAVAGEIMRDFADANPQAFELNLKEGIGDYIPPGTQRAIAGLCLAAGLSGCVTMDQLRTVQTLGRAVQSMERYGVEGAQEELTQEIKNYLRAKQGDPNAQNLSHIYRAEQAKRQQHAPRDPNALPPRVLSREPQQEDYDPDHPPGPESRPTMPAGTARVDVSDMYDWYKLGQHISNLKGLGRHDFGQGPPSTIIAFGSEDAEHKYIKNLEKTGLKTTDIDPAGHKKMPGQKTEPTFNVAEATGYVPVNKREARDPRYVMAITQDVRPGEVQRQARKMGFRTTAAGVPPLLIRELENLLEDIKKDPMPTATHHSGHVAMILKRIGPGYRGSRLHDKIMQMIIRRMGPIAGDESRRQRYQALASDVFDAYAKKHNLTERCWTGYRQAGMKKKGQRQVPNCVPVSENQDSSFAVDPARLKVLYSKIETADRAQRQGRLDVAMHKLQEANQLVYGLFAHIMERESLAIRDDIGDVRDQLEYIKDTEAEYDVEEISNDIMDIGADIEIMLIEIAKLRDDPGGIEVDVTEATGDPAFDRMMAKLTAATQDINELPDEHLKDTQYQGISVSSAVYPNPDERWDIIRWRGTVGGQPWEANGTPESLFIKQGPKKKQIAAILHHLNANQFPWDAADVRIVPLQRWQQIRETAIGVPPVGPVLPMPQRLPRRQPPWPGPGERRKISEIAGDRVYLQFADIAGPGGSSLRWYAAPDRAVRFRDATLTGTVTEPADILKAVQNLTAKQGFDSVSVVMDPKLIARYPRDLHIFKQMADEGWFEDVPGLEGRVKVTVAGEYPSMTAIRGGWQRTQPVAEPQPVRAQPLPGAESDVPVGRDGLVRFKLPRAWFDAIVQSDNPQFTQYLRKATREEGGKYFQMTPQDFRAFKNFVTGWDFVAQAQSIIDQAYAKVPSSQRPSALVRFYFKGQPGSDSV